MQDSETSLLKVQIGPVQDFIAQARSTRDLWSGSYLLSWLVAAGIRTVPNYAENVIFPDVGRQPLLRPADQWIHENQDDLLTPNLPNIFVAKVQTGEVGDIAGRVEKAIREEWRRIAESVWLKATGLGINPDHKDLFFATVDRHLSISWLITPAHENAYAEAYRRNGWHLDAVRQTRHFVACGSGEVKTGAMKDSLGGKEDAICGGSDFQESMTDKSGEIFSLFKHADHVGPTTLIKRLWHITYLRGKNLKTRSGEFKIRSIPAIAARKNKLDDDEERQEKTSGDKYVAAIAFDGDQIGKWVSGELLPADVNLHQHHRDFSKALSEFALDKVRGIVEKIVDGTDQEKKPVKVPLGQLIYAGGDDVVALVPSDAAIEVARQLRDAFCGATKEKVSGTDKAGQTIHPDASAGIAVGHIHAPLQDLIREAQSAEKRAKNEVGRPAFSVTLMKRSGEISRWGSKWDSGGIELYEVLAKLMDAQKLSGKFPHRVIELLESYLTMDKGLSRQSDAITSIESTIELIRKEFAHAASRQGSSLNNNEAAELTGHLNRYLGKVVEAANRKGEEEEKAGHPHAGYSLTQQLLDSLIGLCTTVAFAHRIRRTDNDTSPN